MLYGTAITARPMKHGQQNNDTAANEFAVLPEFFSFDFIEELPLTIREATPVDGD